MASVTSDKCYLCQKYLWQVKLWQKYYSKVTEPIDKLSKDGKHPIVDFSKRQSRN